MQHSPPSFACGSGTVATGMGLFEPGAGEMMSEQIGQLSGHATTDGTQTGYSFS